MRHRLWLAVIAIGLALAASPAVAHAQDLLVVNAPFPFVAQGKTLPAGEYRVTLNENHQEVTITSPKGEATVALVSTRLASSNSPAQADRVAFDKVGNTYYLSELWFTPGEDGFLMYAAKEPHTHQALKATRKAK